MNINLDSQPTKAAYKVPVAQSLDLENLQETGIDSEIVEFDTLNEQTKEWKAQLLAALEHTRQIAREQPTLAVKVLADFMNTGAFAEDIPEGSTKEQEEVLFWQTLSKFFVGDFWLTIRKNPIISFDTFKSLPDLVKQSGWQLEETYMQSWDDVTHVYLIMSKMFPDHKAKSGKRRRYIFVSIDENGTLIVNDEDSPCSLADCKARIRSLDIIASLGWVANSSMVKTVNIRKRKIPLIYLDSDPVPVIERDFVIVRTKDGFFYDGRDGFIDDLDLAQIYTKHQAYRISLKLWNNKNITCKYVHISMLVSDSASPSARK